MSEEHPETKRADSDEERGQIKLTLGKHDHEHDQGDSAHQQQGSGQFNTSRSSSPSVRTGAAGCFGLADQGVNLLTHEILQVVVATSVLAR